MTIHHYMVFTCYGNATRHDAYAAMDAFVYKERYELREMVLPSAEIGNRFAWVPSSFASQPIFNDVMYALDDYMKDKDGLVGENRGVYEVELGNYIEVNCIQFPYANVCIHLYMCSIA